MALWVIFDDQASSTAMAGPDTIAAGWETKTEPARLLRDGVSGGPVKAHR